MQSASISSHLKPTIANMLIRAATIDDSEAIRAIYAEYIDTNITFETELPSADAFRERVASICAHYPYLVGIDEASGAIIGYAYAHALRERAAYQWSAELSIYFANTATGHGLGRILYSELLDQLRKRGFRNAFGCVALPNPASEKLHIAMGFQAVGRFIEAGYKNGGWHDVGWYQKQLL